MVDTIQLGIMAPFYPAPAELAGVDRTYWLIDECLKLGGTVLDRPPVPEDAATRSALRKRLESNGVTMEMSAAGVFGLADPASRREAIKTLRGSIESAQTLGMRIIRTGYGRLTLETSRFASDRPVGEHLGFLRDCLAEAAEIVDGSGVLLAIENHCDFTGRQLAAVFSEIGSSCVGVALDTANGLTVFSDPNDDIEVLAPYSFTTHMKDMRMVANPPPGIPFLPVGCPLGEGVVDFPAAVAALRSAAPVEDLHLIIEPGWEEVPAGAVAADVRREIYTRGMSYLKRLVAEHPEG
jgi:3-oxoisoapionate decarboxylase